MSELPRASALGLVASLLGATAAFAIEEPRSAEPMTPGKQAAVELVSNGVAAKSADDPNCPTVAIAPDGDSRRLDGAKATLDALARDCAVLGAETIVKVGLVGEGERRKKGDAAGFDAPMTIQIKDGDGREVETRRINLRVEMPEGVQRVSFRHVEENVSLPPPSADGYANWTIVVGLDPATPGEAQIAESEGELATGDDQADEAANRDQRRSSRSWKSRRYSASRTGAMGRASRYARRDRSSRDAAVSRQPSGRMAVTLTPQTRAQDQGQGLARVTTEIRPRPAAQQPQPAAAPARPTPAARTAPAARSAAAASVPQSAPGAANGSDSPWKKVASSFKERRDGPQPQAQQRDRRPASGQTQAAAQQPATTRTN